MSARARWTILTAVLLALIILPFTFFGARLDVFAAAWLAEATGHPVTAFAGIVALLAADIVLPVPSSIVSTAAGAILGFGWGAVASLFGMTIACLGGYAIGRAAGRGAADRVVPASELAQAEALAARHGDWMLVTTRAVPILAEASTVFAGVAAMPVARFVAVTSLANIGISLAYAFVGASAAELSSFLMAVAGAVLLPIAARTLASQRLRAGRRST